MPGFKNFPSHDCSTIIYEANWLAIFSHIGTAFQRTVLYFWTLYSLIFLHMKYQDLDSIFKNDIWAKVQVYSLSLIFKLWSQKHYRSASYQQDMIDNLKNVAIPGTGVPLSIFCYSYWTCLAFVLFINPTICFMGAINKSRKGYDSLEDLVKKTCDHFLEHLFHPDDWFSLWRLNCRLVSLHSSLTKSQDYSQEDKWTFLTDGKKLGVPVSPYFDNFETLVCKNKNIEGGMGIFFYKNAASGGDWILQEKLGNAPWLQELLPSNAPLSTMRVITTSTYSLSAEEAAASINSASADNHASSLAKASDYIKAESGVLRLGRANAATDHSSILFDVDIASGEIRQGTSNAHWYSLGVLKSVLHCPWLAPQDVDSVISNQSSDSNSDNITKSIGSSNSGGPILYHLDAPHPRVAGKVIPDMKLALDIVIDSHFKMMPNVPIVGWDVAFTPTGIYLLEVNLSCNFFKGTFDLPRYIALVDRYWKQLQVLEQKQEVQ